MAVTDDAEDGGGVSPPRREGREAEDVCGPVTDRVGETGAAGGLDVVLRGPRRSGRARGGAASPRYRAGRAEGGRPAPVEDKTRPVRGGAQPPAAACGVELIDPDVLRREIGSDDVLGEVDERPGPTSAEDEQRLAFLRRYAAAPGGLFRRHLVADAGTLARVAAVASEAPNAAQVVDVVTRAATLSWRAGSPLRLPPLLILGEPGSGKTRFARRIAAALGATSTTIDGGSTTDRGPFVGHDAGYRGGGPGRVARALLDGSTTGPVVVVDEVDKVSAYAQGVRPLDALLPLLEPGTAGQFVDTYITLSMRAEGVNWIMTANGVAGLPAPLLDRVIVVAMPRLGRAEARDAIRRMFAALLAEYGLPDAALGDAALDRLQAVGLRQAGRALSLALGPALAAGRPAPDTSDVAGAAALVTRSPSRARRRSSPAPAPPRRPVGFIRFPP